MQREGPWVSASELAEYAYCPRSHWYSAHPEEVQGPVVPDRRAGAGVLYHQRTLSAERRHDEHVGLYVGLFLLGIGLVAIALIVLGGL